MFLYSLFKELCKRRRRKQEVTTILSSVVCIRFMQVNKQNRTINIFPFFTSEVLSQMIASCISLHSLFEKLYFFKFLWNLVHRCHIFQFYYVKLKIFSHWSVFFGKRIVGIFWWVWLRRRKCKWDWRKFNEFFAHYDDYEDAYFEQYLQLSNST